MEEAIRKVPKEVGACTRNWIDPAQDIDYWRVIINMVFKVRILLDVSNLLCYNMRSCPNSVQAPWSHGLSCTAFNSCYGTRR